MGGLNPYIKSADARLPEAPYQVTFVLRAGGEQREIAVRVDPAALPYTGEGLPGSLLDVACGHGVEIDHACGGVCACSTCHVHVRQGASSCAEPSEAEEDMLDLAPGLDPSSRLACQCVPDGTLSLRVVVPDWNRNTVSEGSH